MPGVEPDLLGPRTQGLVTAAQLRQAGIGTDAVRRHLVAGHLVKVRKGVYAAGPLPALPRFVVTEQGVAPVYVLAVRATLLSLRGTATARGRTAAALRGWGLLVEPSRTIEVAVPHGRSRAAAKGVRVQQRRRLTRERVHVLADTDPLWLTDPVQTVLDCCRDLPFVEAVVICDSALRSGDVTIEALVRAVRRQCGVLHAARARRVIAAADPACGSVLESVLRCRLLLAGICGFTTQVVLGAANGGDAMRVDFCFEAVRLVVEVDGQKWHQDVARDRRRDNTLARRGYRVLRYTWAEVVHDADRVVAEIAEAALLGSGDFHYVTPGVARAA